MNSVFPDISTTSIDKALPGSIIAISRNSHLIFALVTDHIKNGSRSLVFLNRPIDHGGTLVCFAEGWTNNEPALCYNSSIRFEIDTASKNIDATGYKHWDTPGLLVSIDGDLYIRAAPFDTSGFYDFHHRLVNIRTGSLLLGTEPNKHWTFLFWQLWLRDSIAERHVMLFEYSLGNLST